MTNEQTYYRIRVKKVPANLEDEMTELSFEHGCTGLSEALNYVQKDLVYDPEIRPQRFHDMDVFFTTKPNPDFIPWIQILSAKSLKKFIRIG